jgi:hypothetical protein
MYVNGICFAFPKNTPIDGYNQGYAPNVKPKTTHLHSSVHETWTF